MMESQWNGETGGMHVQLSSSRKILIWNMWNSFIFLWKYKVEYVLSSIEEIIE